MRHTVLPAIKMAAAEAVAKKRGKVSSAMPVGSEVSFTTVLGTKLRGNVVATDESAECLVIKDAARSVHIVNLKHVSELNVLSRPSPSAKPPSLPPVDLHKVETRIGRRISERKRAIRRLGVNVSKEAQMLFDFIVKTYNDTEWQGDAIVVLGEVMVSPPYTVQSCSNVRKANSSDALECIKKIVSKFHLERSPAPLS